MATEKCRVCPLIVPECTECPAGQSCIIVSQSCNVCAYTSCLDNSQISAGHYTIGSTGVLGPISTENPVGTASRGQSSSAESSVTSASTTDSSAVATTTGSSAAMQTSMSSSSAAAQSTSSIAASISSQLSSSVSSATSTPTTGAAPTIGFHAMETQGLAWVLMVFWIGMGVFGGRRWRL